MRLSRLVRWLSLVWRRLIRRRDSRPKSAGLVRSSYQPLEPLNLYRLDKQQRRPKP